MHFINPKDFVCFIYNPSVCVCFGVLLCVLLVHGPSALKWTWLLSLFSLQSPSYRVASKKVHQYQMKKIVLNRIKACRLYLFVKLKYQSRAIILFVAIRYSMRDVLSDLNNYAWPSNWRYASETVNDVSSLSLSLSLSLWHQLALASCEFYVQRIF